MSQIYLLVEIVIVILFLKYFLKCSLKDLKKTSKSFNIFFCQHLTILWKLFYLFLFVDWIIDAHSAIPIKKINIIWVFKKKSFWSTKIRYNHMKIYSNGCKYTFFWKIRVQRHWYTLFSIFCTWLNYYLSLDKNVFYAVKSLDV